MDSNPQRSFFKSNGVLAQSLFTAIFLTIFILIAAKLMGSFSLNINTDSSSRVFTVEGTSKSTSVPQIAQTTFTVTETGATQKEAQDKGNDKQNKALAILSSLGIEKKDIKTEGYNINEDFDYSSGRASSKGFIITISTSAKSKNTETINTAISRIAELGINIGGVQFIKDDTADDNSQARTDAINDAKKKAQELAKAAGFKVGKIVSISEYTDSNPGPLPYDMKMLSARPAVENAQTSLEPGSVDTQYHVSITYSID